MANEMGGEILEPQTTPPEEIESGYKIYAYLATNLPKEFRNLVFDSFLNSLRYGNDLFKLIDKECYYKAYGNFVNVLLQRPKAIIRLAMLSDKTVLGWSLTEMDIVHYVWVKNEVRRQGIGKALLPNDFKFISHVTHRGINIWTNKFPDVRFNPFI